MAGVEVLFLSRQDIEEIRVTSKRPESRERFANAQLRSRAARYVAGRRKFCYSPPVNLGWRNIPVTH